MSKTFHPSKRQEWQALDRINLVVHEMNCFFREISKDDFGIDGEIELVVPKAAGEGWEVSGAFIKVQARSGKSYVKQDSESRFVTPVKRDELMYWYKATNPVAFIVYHPLDDQLYWKEVKRYIQNTPDVWQRPLQIEFLKEEDTFTPACYDRLCEIAAVSPPRVSKKERERLFSNLLLVKQIPRTIWSAQTPHKAFLYVEDDLRSRGEFVHPFSIIGDYLYTLADLRNDNCPLRTYCNTDEISSIAASEWWKDKALRLSYVSMLNRLLRIHIYRLGLRYNPVFSRYFFPRENDDDLEFKRAWFNVRTGRRAQPRLVAKYYEYGADKFWRHLAADLRFKMIGSSWFLQVIPRYFFTYDGRVPWDSEKVGSYTTRKKAMEWNPHVLNHVLFWSDVLSGRKKSITLKLDFKNVLVMNKKPLDGLASFAIPLDPAVYDEPPEEKQLDLFEPWVDEDDESDAD